MRFIRLMLAVILLTVMLPITGAQASASPESTLENFAYGSTYTVKADLPNATFSELEYKTYSGPVEGLVSNAPTWTGFARQDGREVVVDLGKLKTIEQVSLEFRQDPAQAIMLPPYLKVDVSQDGQNWSALGQMHHAVSPEETVERTFQFVFAPLQARYVKMYFPVDIWTFARNLKVLGDPTAQESGPVVLEPSKDDQASVGSYMNLPNNQDILLIYTGAHEEKGIWNKDEFKSVVAYMKDGSAQDTMFDTMLFLPYEAVESTEAAWTAYIDDLFQDKTQLGALNQAASEVHRNRDFKQKVILSIPFPDATKPDFWLEEGKEGIDTVDGQKKAIKWYLDTLMAKWHAANYEHLELSGIYWWKEKIEMQHTDEEALVKHTASLVHRHQQPFFWIPYYGAKGYSEWKELGFDHVIIQPNFYAKEVPKDDRMPDVANLARKFEMGVEVEIDEWVLVSRYHYDAFYNQLNKGHELGFDGEVTNAYYAGNKTIHTLANSDIPMLRKVYDDLYRWIKGNYQPKN
ncbi:hypothetical protein BEP19_01350 [Ammoniphilus oxalaticus]|uniref:F5/8 type C domain-containing protein n=1 Tax=Ammoniphilus oxalaticus TaxID=66863 RepID=A0A419SMV3_9BACL|nr:DUF4855 domain-containing protein [Ammoniphilus oxalaticus]RKD25617.1 hypothetical protein BEP19_01350 [Ammoniphilus oxalaticus]